MAVDKLKFASGNGSSTTTSSSITNTDTSLPLTSDTDFAAKSGAGMVIIDEGESTEEYAYATGKSGSSLTIPLVNRGLEGGSAQAHASSASVRGILSASMWNDMADSLKKWFSDSSGEVAPTLGSDADGDVYYRASSVLTRLAKGTAGQLLKMNSGATAPEWDSSVPTGDIVGTTDTQTITNKNIVQKVTAYTPAGAATATLDVSVGSIHAITMPAGNITIAVSNEAAGKCFMVEIIQDGTGSRTVTWFSTIKWAGGSAPTLTTTADKKDVLGFRVTGTDTYDGFIVGQDL